MAGDDVGQGVGMIPGHHLGMCGGARGEVGQHQIPGAGGFHIVPAQIGGSLGAGRLEGSPARAHGAWFTGGITAGFAADDDAVLQRGTLRRGLVHLVRVLGGDDGDARAGFVDAVGHVPGREQHRAGNGHHPGLDAPDQHLVEGRHAGNLQQREVPLGRAQGAQHVGHPVGGRRQVRIAVALDGLAGGGNVDEGFLVRASGPAVDHVETEVVELGNLQPEIVLVALIVPQVGRIDHGALRKLKVKG